MPDLKALIDDLADEQAGVDVLVADLAAQGWSLATPAEGWSVRHQIAHLTYFDAAAVTAIEAPEQFAVLRAEADTDPEGYGERVLVRYLELSGSGLLEKWRAGRDRLTKALCSADKGVRVPWYGPSMSVASMATARLMETWAHGQDIADALGTVREPSRRLEHVARLACLAMPYSYLVRGRPVPDAAVRVELTGPDQRIWTFGDAAATDVVTGPLADFCLVLTRRRHVADTRLTARGPVAEEWLAIGQAYAGPPGTGRSPGQFPTS